MLITQLFCLKRFKTLYLTHLFLRTFQVKYEDQEMNNLFKVSKWKVQDKKPFLLFAKSLLCLFLLVLHIFFHPFCHEGDPGDRAK